MTIGRARVSLALAILAAALVAAITLPVSATALSVSLGDQFVRVNVGFNVLLPLTDTSEQTLISSQQSGRKFVYNMASKECAVLKATIAKTCRLTHLNLSAQIREHANNQPMKLYLNANAQFAITLKEE